MSEQPRVFLVDDQAAVRKALARLLASAGFDVLALDSAQAFLDSDWEQASGCLVLDLSMPGMDGMALQRLLAERCSSLPLIFLTGQGDIATGVQAMKLGAFDFLTKPVDDERLIGAVTAALARNHEVRAQLAERKRLQTLVASLTPREREVLELVVRGLMNKQVAAQLGTVEKTIKVHRARVMEKMNVRSLAELVRLADRAGITSRVGE